MTFSRIAAAAALALATLTAGTASSQAPQGFSVRETHGDWRVICADAGNNACVMEQTVTDGSGNPLMNVQIEKIGQGQVVGAMILRAPLGTFLPRGVTMQIDSGEPLAQPFEVCSQVGCITRLAMSEEGASRMKRGAAATVTIYAFANPDQAVAGRLSLSGFTKAFNAL